MRQPAAIFLCDITGVMAEPWAAAGYVCFCVDIQHSIRATASVTHKVKKYEGGGEIHFVYGDARSWKPSSVRPDFHATYRILFVAAFPVCTNLAGSGARDWGLKGIPALADGLLLFNACEQVADWSGAPYCVENPVGCVPTHHRKPDFYFHPWFYGDLYQKYTCLWTGNGFRMPAAECVTKPAGVTQKIWLASPGPDRQNKRSATPAGFAKAVFLANTCPENRAAGAPQPLACHSSHNSNFLSKH